MNISSLKRFECQTLTEVNVSLYHRRHYHYITKERETPTKENDISAIKNIEDRRLMCREKSRSVIGRFSSGSSTESETPSLFPLTLFRCPRYSWSWTPDVCNRTQSVYRVVIKTSFPKSRCDTTINGNETFLRARQGNASEVCNFCDAVEVQGRIAQENAPGTESTSGQMRYYRVTCLE